jgi:hypothetical protein
MLSRFWPAEAEDSNAKHLNNHIPGYAAVKLAASEKHGFESVLFLCIED